MVLQNDIDLLNPRGGRSRRQTSGFVEFDFGIHLRKNQNTKNSKKKIRSMEVPDDIVEVILSKLPFFSLPSCRLVCKQWNNLILNLTPNISNSNLSFAHIYPDGRNLQCVDFNLEGEVMSSFASFKLLPNRLISIIDSCNGLLLLISQRITEPKTKLRPHRDDVFILNPMTNEYFKIPISKSHMFIDYNYGLGFSPKTNQYKITRTSSIRDGSATLVEIFAFATRKWTHLGLLPPYIGNHAVYFDGSLYWIDDISFIFRLDIEHEKLHKISFLQSSSFIGVLHDTLYLTTWFGVDGDVDEYHVWTMERDSSWSKTFVVFIPKYDPEDPDPLASDELQLLKICKDGKILCLENQRSLMLYDSKTKMTAKILTDQEVYDSKTKTTAKILTNQEVELKKPMVWFSVHPIHSFHFNSLHNCLSGNG